MTIRQTIFLLVFFVFVVFQFSLLIVRNTFTFLSTAQVEAFFLVILISLLSTALAERPTLVSNIAIATSTAAGLGIYFFSKQYFSSSGIDWFVSVALIAGAGVTILTQQAVAGRYMIKST